MHLNVCTARPADDRYIYSSIPTGSIRLLALLPDDDPNSPLTCQLIDHVLRRQHDDGRPDFQIRLMAEIYCRANRVVVWLGEAENGGDVALEQIRAAAIPEAIQEDWGMAILLLLQRPWFRRIWVLQEVAAARHILVKCGAAEIDGYAFCHGLRSMESYLHALRQPKLLGRINPIVYLVRGSIFRPKSYTTGPSGEVSLGIRPFRELLNMYRTHRATDPRDRIFALLGMCSDGPTLTAAGLSPDYTISWQDLVSRLAKFLLGNHVTTELKPGQGAAERVLIKGRGYFLGKVDEEYTKQQRNGWQEITMILHGGIAPPPHDLPAPAVRVQRDDIVCQLIGASEPTLVRPCPDGCFAIIAIAVPALPDNSSREEASND
ncbi:hypothetical protein B0H67DRAFT_531124, partial [Lasiosphaeris hirsuta]